MKGEFALDSGEVCIWCLELTADDCVTTRFQSMLTPEEVAHAAQFRFELTTATVSLAFCRDGVLYMLTTT